MGNSIPRDLYFSTKIEHQETAERYLKGLLSSPYRQHQRIGRQLQEQYKEMLAEELAKQKQEEEKESI